MLRPLDMPVKNLGSGTQTAETRCTRNHVPTRVAWCGAVRCGAVRWHGMIDMLLELARLQAELLVARPER